ncbi:MAG: DUF4297 domain-containing protein [Bacteroidales bacterium]|nr:DUF4297 domain-containing protein [Bacteroidales bacterium]
MAIIESPNEVISSTDKGDDIQRRFRYQCTYAALLSLYMFEPDSEIKEVYCELHEDIMIKLKSGKFGGIQVKTRELHLGPFELNDPEIKKSIIRFIQHELQFKDKFEHYTISTNVGFSKDKNKCIETLINLAKKDRIDELLKARSKSKVWIQSISRNAKCDDNVVISILKKLRLFKGISSIDDIEIKFTKQLSDILHLGDETISSLNVISDFIILHHIKASSLSNLDKLSEYYILCIEPKEEEIKAIIKSKTITKEAIEEIVEKFKSEPITLCVKDSTGLPKSKESKILELKMDAGNISYDNIQLAKDNMYSFECLITSWLYKYDQNEVEKRYNQVKLIINNESQEAFDETKSTESFGTKMLINLRKRIKERHQREPNIFFNCKHEHLLGLVAILTEECKVWWSDKFDIKK